MVEPSQILWDDWWTSHQSITGATHGDTELHSHLTHKRIGLTINLRSMFLECWRKMESLKKPQCMQKENKQTPHKGHGSDWYHDLCGINADV